MRLGLSLAITQPGKASASSTPATIFGANLVGWLKENYTAGTGVWVDESATAVNTSASAGTIPAAATINGHTCATFNGTSDALIWGGNRAILTGDFCIAGAFQSSTFLASPRVLVGKLFSTIAYWVGSSNVTSNKFCVDVSDASDTTEAISANSYNDGLVHTFIAVRSGTTQTLYMDGTTVEVDTGTKAAVPTTTDQLAIGAAISSGGSMQYFWSGSIGNLVLANAAPSVGQIAALSAYLKSWSGT